MNQVQLIGNLTRAVEIKQYGHEEDRVFGRTRVRGPGRDAVRGRLRGPVARPVGGDPSRPAPGRGWRGGGRRRGPGAGAGVAAHAARPRHAGPVPGQQVEGGGPAPAEPGMEARPGLARRMEGAGGHDRERPATPARGDRAGAQRLGQPVVRPWPDPHARRHRPAAGRPPLRGLRAGPGLRPGSCRW